MPFGKSNTAKNGGRKRSMLERFIDLFSPKQPRPQPRPQPNRQYTYPRGDGQFPHPSSTRGVVQRGDTFCRTYDRASPADKTGFLNWKKAFRNYNNALTSSKAQKRAERVEREREQEKLSRLKAEVQRYYGRPGSMALVDAYNRRPEEQERYEAFVKEYPALDRWVNHAELHARVGPAYIHSPSFGRRKTSPELEAVSPERLAAAKPVLEKGNREREERERQRDAEARAIRYNSTRRPREHAPQANEKRKVDVGPSPPTVPRKPVPGGVVGSARTPSSAPRQYKAYQPAQQEPEPNPFSNRGLRINDPKEKRAQDSRNDSGYSSSNDSSPSSNELSSQKMAYEPNVYMTPPEHHPDSYQERERRLRRTKGQVPARRPTHYRGRELDYSHHESSSNPSMAPVHPAFREANAPQAKGGNGGTYLNYQSLRRNSSPPASSRFPIPDVPPRHSSRKHKRDDNVPRAPDKRPWLDKPLPQGPKESQIPRPARKQSRTVEGRS